MTWWLWTLIGIYTVGFFVSLWINVTMLPVTGGLALLRSFLWPLWLLGLIPGEPLRMD